MKSPFFLQKSDRMAILVLLAVIAVAGIVIWGVGGRYQSTPLSLTDSLSMSRQRDTIYRQAPHHFYHHTSAKSERLFPFDPNTADARQLSRLGLKDWQVRNLLKYRQAGGRFRKPSDFARLYGLTTREYERLRPYIRVHEEPRAFSLKATPEVYHRDSLRYPVKLSPGQTLSLNDADTTALRQVPGIGPVYARRIVSYRQRLGGFYRVEQLREIADFPPSALPYFELGSGNLRKLDVNRLTLQQLKAHPYINFYQARAITEYHRLHGPLHSLQQLRLLKEFSPRDIERLEPYLQY